MFKTNSLTRRLDRITTDICSYSTFHGSFKDADRTRTIDRMVSMVAGLEIKREIVWGDAAASSWVYPSRVKQGYTQRQATAAHAVLDGLVALHARLGQKDFDSVVYSLKQYTRPLGWETDLDEHHADLAKGIADLDDKIAAHSKALVDASQAYRTNPSENVHAYIRRLIREKSFYTARRHHFRDALAKAKTKDDVIQGLHNALKEAGVIL